MSRGIRGRKGADVSAARERSLATRPIRNPFVRTERPEGGAEGEGAGGGAVLRIPIERTRRGRLVAWILKRLSRRPVPEFKHIELDEIGAFIWNLCDGTRTTREMIAQLASAYHLNRRDAEASLSEFLRMLGRRSLVGFQIEANTEE